MGGRDQALGAPTRKGAGGSATAELRARRGSGAAPEGARGSGTVKRDGASGGGVGTEEPVRLGRGRKLSRPSEGPVCAVAAAARGGGGRRSADRSGGVWRDI